MPSMKIVMVGVKSLMVLNARKQMWKFPGLDKHLIRLRPHDRALFEELCSM